MAHNLELSVARLDHILRGFIKHNFVILAPVDLHLSLDAQRTHLGLAEKVLA